jgi:hypothetical protein
VIIRAMSKPVLVRLLPWLPLAPTAVEVLAVFPPLEDDVPPPLDDPPLVELPELLPPPLLPVEEPE